MKFCSNCGFNLENNKGNYCSNCGKSLHKKSYKKIFLSIILIIILSILLIVGYFFIIDKNLKKNSEEVEVTENVKFPKVEVEENYQEVFKKIKEKEKNDRKSLTVEEQEMIIKYAKLTDELASKAMEEAEYDYEFNLEKRPDFDEEKFKEVLKYNTKGILERYYHESYEIGYKNAPYMIKLKNQKKDNLN